MATFKAFWMPSCAGAPANPSKTTVTNDCKTLATGRAIGDRFARCASRSVLPNWRRYGDAIDLTGAQSIALFVAVQADVDIVRAIFPLNRQARLVSSAKLLRRSCVICRA